ncbi:hypothetical protein HELRODRAFT_73674, partial [Helobdella robusta]|uniref:Thyrotropin-releasing hormone receptor n=1 Tax=Helobdella robusta TaxID=6412 RepID=T1G1H2_HELRO
YSNSYRLVGSLLVGSIFMVGLMGNIMVVIVVSRWKSMHTPTNCYLVSLAVADLLLLIFACPPTIVDFFNIVDDYVFGRVACKSMVFAQYLAINLGSLSITAFTVERFAAICHPILTHRFCTVERALRILACLWLFGLAYCSPWLFLADTKQSTYDDGTMTEECTFKIARNHYFIYFMADLIVFYLLPLITSVLLYVLIARRLYRGAGMRASDRSDNKNDNNTSSHNSNNTIAHKQTTFANRNRVIKMLAIVVLMFAVLWLPYRAYVVYNSLATPLYCRWTLLTVRIMVYANSSINPILYSAMSSKFRRAFICLLSFRSKRFHQQQQLLQQRQQLQSLQAYERQMHNKRLSACLNPL